MNSDPEALEIGIVAFGGTVYVVGTSVNAKWRRASVQSNISRTIALESPVSPLEWKSGRILCFCLSNTR